MRKLKRKKYWYIQDWGSYRNETPIFVGYSVKEITAIIKRQKNWLKQPVEAWVKGQGDSEQYFSNQRDGGIWFHEGWTVFWLKKYEDTWDDYETIMHECFHLVINICGRNKAMVNHSTQVIEEEAMAYQQEYLFRNIREKLQKEFL